MDRINGANTIDIGGGRRGFRNEDLPSGTPGTEVTALFLNMVQEEMLAVIEGAGMAADDADWTQFLKALRIFSVRRTTWMPVVSMTLTEPPEAPIQGDAYLIPAGATGAWAGNAGKLADWTGSQWSMVTQPNGHGIALPDGRVFVRVGGTYIEKLALDAQSGKWTYAAAAGSANALTATLAPVPASYASITGATIVIKTGAAANTGAMTLNLNGLGAKSIVHTNGSAMANGEVPASSMLPLTFDGTNFVAFAATPSPSAASETAQGVIELATAAETIAGIDNTRAVHPAGLAARVASETATGLVEFATAAETIAGTDNTRAVHPAGLAARTATEARAGIVELATVAEAKAGSDTTRAVHPAGLAAAIADAITNLINGSPAALDTLNELATALGDDANFAATMTTALAGKVDLTRTALETRAGIVELATAAEAKAGVSTTLAVHPAGLKGAIDDAAIGNGQTWQNLTGSRAMNTSYQNTTGRSIMVALEASAGDTLKYFEVSGDNTTWVQIGRSEFSNGADRFQILNSTGPFLIPPGWYYRYRTTAGGDATTWAELR